MCAISTQVPFRTAWSFGSRCITRIFILYEASDASADVAEAFSCLVQQATNFVACPADSLRYCGTLLKRDISLEAVEDFALLVQYPRKTEA